MDLTRFSEAPSSAPFSSASGAEGWAEASGSGSLAPSPSFFALPRKPFTRARYLRVSFTTESMDVVVRFRGRQQSATESLQGSKQRGSAHRRVQGGHHSAPRVGEAIQQRPHGLLFPLFRGREKDKKRRDR